MLFLLHLALEGITEVDTDPKERFVFIKITPSNDRVICLCPLQVIVPGNSWVGGRGSAFLKD